uniref:CxC2 domain-containing protein n=1 Tax=Macrostomum lignano TaxID=282301 RepID=A0A1I8HNS3_9PLAT
RCTHDLYSSCACCKWVSLGQPARHCPGSACYCTHDLYSSCACCKWVSLGHFTCTNSTEYHLSQSLPDEQIDAPTLQCHFLHYRHGRQRGHRIRRARIVLSMPPVNAWLQH